MGHPICGKCQSANVYKEYDAAGFRVIACFKCGSRYPGSGIFYMSNNDSFKKRSDIKGIEGIMEEKSDIEKEVKLCSVCNAKPTISESSPYCASCMAKKGNEKRWQNAGKPSKNGMPKKTQEDTSRGEKVALRANMTVGIDFNKHPNILKQVEELANDQIRTVEAQIIFLLKSHFEGVNYDVRNKTGNTI